MTWSVFLTFAVVLASVTFIIFVAFLAWEFLEKRRDDELTRGLRSLKIKQAEGRLHELDIQDFLRTLTVARYGASHELIREQILRLLEPSLRQVALVAPDAGSTGALPHMASEVRPDAQPSSPVRPVEVPLSQDVQRSVEGVSQPRTLPGEPVGACPTRGRCLWRDGCVAGGVYSTCRACGSGCWPARRAPAPTG
jgi:hypothetical protein